MKRLVATSILAAVLGSAAVWAAVEALEARKAQLPGLMPEGALLYIEAKDFGGLLGDWNSSPEKKAWLAGDNYEAFSRSRLYSRLSQAQDEFSTTAGIPTDAALLAKVAGHESSLAIYDIGNLAFVYVTRMDQAQVETTPLWQVRSRFEQRTEGAAQFFVHTDQQTSRTAAFAALDGWLILATRDDLVAGVIDRLQGTKARSLPDEDWYSSLIKQAGGSAQPELRMALNLDQLVPSPYFRSYWVQRNATEMKQYSAALSDLYRAPNQYREERLLLRKSGAGSPVAGDVSAVTQFAPDDATFFSAQASPDPATVLKTLRENLLEQRPALTVNNSTAPAAPSEQNAGDASRLEDRIDLAPAVEQQSDAWQPLRTQLGAAQPTAMLQVYADQKSPDNVFVSLPTGFVIAAAQDWSERPVLDALAATLQPGLTTAKLGLGWEKHPGTTGEYLALNGQIPLYAALRGKQLLLASDSGLMEKMLARTQSQSAPTKPTGVTYTAVFRHSHQQQQDFHLLFTRLDRAGHTGSTPQNSDADGQSPDFFSGNVASLDKMFSSLDQEKVDEIDSGAKVTQTVTYEWKH